ncbi:GNAT family N-acetyltransferase [Erythrobacter sp. SCSIO 43205]|uniref:GNAT family N-acetyltransferase n=1 Tax=Erythrobacter sp. SCSIO 43205 TaxID=2779361 RepID=UPI001CA8BFC5|nr:GNAT family N-acetyltransferase [Erythrobacter sp. SCSIO 43205]UAB77276.1 GNAT family N-acetyltransferase [Erythrobacter sp. SCSIO 43205]
MIEARYHDEVNVLQELFEDSSLAKPRAPFDRASWYALLAEAGLRPLIAIASDQNNAAALALTENHGHITPLRNWYSFTWRQLAPEGDRGDALLLEIAKQLKNRSHRVTLEPVPDEDGSATRLAAAFNSAGWRVEVVQCDTNHVLHVNGRSFDDYWLSRPGPLRTTLKRKGAKVKTRILTHFDADAWDAYETIYEASWKPSEDNPEMLRRFAEQEGEAGRLRLGLAMCEGIPVAAQCWTVENGCAYIHKLAHLQSARKLSAGTTLSAALFKHAIDVDGVGLVDFGTGTQSYKADWMEDVRPRYRIDCFNLSSLHGWHDLARLTARRLTLPEVPMLAPSPPRS